jgi:N-acetylneuraminate synthase
MPEKQKVTIIAECGVNHNGDLKLAKEMIDVACDAGADYVKFQTFKVDALVKRDAPMAAYQQNNLKVEKSQYEMLKNYELKENDFKHLYEYTLQKNEAKFLSTPFDVDALHFLRSLGLNIIKISSGDLTNGPLLLETAKAGLSIILSSGMSTLDEVRIALSILKWGYERGQEDPLSLRDILDYSSAKNFESIAEKVSLLHCLSEYPAPSQLMNLRAMTTLENEFSIPIGFSDHSLGTYIPVAATALGAKVIEKHFTLDQNLPGPDHKASLTPSELKRMVLEIRETESALGNGIKVPRGNEKDTAKIVRKSMYAKGLIKKGQIFTEDNMECLRPENQTSPFHFWDIKGNCASKDYQPGDPL